MKQKKKTCVANMLPQPQSVTVSMAPWRGNRHTPPPSPPQQRGPQAERRKVLSFSWMGEHTQFLVPGKVRLPCYPGLLPQPRKVLGPHLPPTGIRQLQISMFYLILCKLKRMRIFGLQKKKMEETARDTGSRALASAVSGPLKSLRLLVRRGERTRGKIRKI